MIASTATKILNMDLVIIIIHGDLIRQVDQQVDDPRVV
jgi:hypothetical protein